MHIKLSEEQIEMIIDALAGLSRDCMAQAGEAKGYSNQTRDKMMSRGVGAHDLCENVAEQLQDLKEKEHQRQNREPIVDPYDAQWPINDPRKW